MTATPGSKAKLELRQHFRRKRRQIIAAQRNAWDRQIHQGLLSLPGLAPGSCISAFYPFDGEPDLRPTLSELHETGHRVCLPLISKQSGGSLTMHAWHPDLPLVSGHLGILEPDAGEAVPLEALDIVLLPLVAWDRCGNRLGMGAGYYDHFLAPVSGSQQPLRAGVAYALQESHELPADAWDVPLHAVLTEQGWTWFDPALQGAKI